MKMTKKTGEEGAAEVNPDGDSGSDNDCPEENVEVNKSSALRGRRCGHGRKMWCGCDHATGRGENN